MQIRAAAPSLVEQGLGLGHEPQHNPIEHVLHCLDVAFQNFRRSLCKRTQTAWPEQQENRATRKLPRKVGPPQGDPALPVPSTSDACLPGPRVIDHQCGGSSLEGGTHLLDPLLMPEEDLAWPSVFKSVDL
ncbi:Hypothetical predicted protein [Pelobates cultripes]|uniref:Uncharacterized protein n=1 Tax=Pelobates cultripes TaxID=61616 RepID=A0AAD1W614_PELCU|nr:Hypothetical predicted protein [Pelobates cultripes]